MLNNNLSASDTKHLQSVLPKTEPQGTKTLFSLQAGPFHTGT